ncbi:alpha/beta fold hydrolase [Verminephrobacter eiseniae]|uniref:alpha/beta fold hydrolase n=1 Tax=Verminephrobacter eiseniae TaxID=364317 RepID=UPI0010F13816|nr:alpha/beta hydrolase [Verminephrobacter eiseniae]KAB7634557.1 alpha/beta hydrolase [Verminephrobacter sp. Larva24]MCW5234747.1 alpha/beta hydrolase [Verminephrobacter eiseniae]MCW5293678.1 alpha/beta hydrolase [Verminephrobacter eiseniae]MCW8183469.1 alpha/beta hydrolase [Verminephrobacter eiseniae]MCW8224714.1 alpha/beta hydrolase [Verminephrobacter eiseniae]
MQRDIPLVMVHGLFGPLHFFQPTIRMSGVAVHTPDLLGYGGRAAPTELSLAVQANEIVRFLHALDSGPCHLLGHSVGAAVAMLSAELAPQLVKSIISVEGNFTLDDAFMCRRIAPLPAAEWQAELQRIQNQPADWLAKEEIAVTTERLQMANCILHNQSAATLQAMARAVVKETADQAYLNTVRKLMQYGTPLHLVAGSRSAGNWNVPEWVRQGAASSLVLAGCGHMMMLEDPDLFCNSLLGLLYS